jgi:uncharacterized protein YndB with AHSA1/START domain
VRGDSLVVTFQFTVIVNRPVDEVFSYLTNIDRMPEWQSMVLEARKTTPGPMAVGTRIDDVRKFLGRRLESTVEVTAFEPNKSYDLTVVSGPIPVTMKQRLESPTPGTTCITVNGEGQPGGFFKLAEPLVGRQAERHWRQDFETLKDLVEARAG